MGKIYIGDDSLESEGLGSRIEEILLRGKIFYPDLPDSNWIVFLLGLPIGFGIFLQNKGLIVTGVLIVLLSVLWTGLHSRFDLKRHNMIVFKLRKEAPNFWKRNKDNIVLLAIGSIFGFVLKIIYDLF